ncbi:hypothetical protein [Haloechinothrix salitolerans]|uniref:Uncharacterized protein n=1 Tax=Haloechinothrix salitolerans TaxID=926830 RepID=A0ABW2C6C5_9PSEU
MAPTTRTPDPAQALRGRLGAAVRRGNAALAAELRAELRAAWVARQIESLVNDFELTQEQRDRLAALLCPSIDAVTAGGGGDGDGE